MSATVSIIVPVYNAELYLEECVYSILGQSITNIQVILVDDGSTDHSTEICDRWASVDTRVRCVHQANCGQSKALMAGYALSDGEWLFFVDSDDTLPKDAIEALLSCATGDENIIIGLSYDDNGSIETISAENWCRKMVRGDALLCTRWGKIYRRCLFNGTELDVDSSISVGEDMLMNVVLAFRNDLPIRMLKRRVYNYRHPITSLTSTYRWSLEKYARLYYQMSLLVSNTNNEYISQLIRNGVGMIRDLCISESIFCNRIRESNLWRQIMDSFSSSECHLSITENILLLLPDFVFTRLCVKGQYQGIKILQYISRKLELLVSQMK